MREVVIVSGVRTPIGSMGGGLLSLSQRKLTSIVIKEALNRAQIEPGMVDDIFMGCCMNNPEDQNVARCGALEAGIPITVPGVTLNMVCPSAMEALANAARMIMCNEADIVIAGGVESMSNAPYLLKTARWGSTLRHQELTDALWEGLHAGGPEVMGITAENIAEKYQISREDQDEVALRSHNNVERATNEGRFKDEIVPVNIKNKKAEMVLDKDEHFRSGLTMEKLATLPPAFKKGGTVTAGNSSGLNDGAAAVVMMSREKTKELGIKPMLKYLTNAKAGVEPSLMGIGPIPATRKALERANMQLSDIDLIELNEAFASQYIACERGLNLNREITNVNGSGIGLGHPVGCTGVRLVVTLMHEMIKRDMNLGLAALCGGGGIGMATIFERI